MAVRFDASTERYTAANGTGGTAFTACCWAYMVTNRADFQVILAFENAGSSASQGMYLMTGASGLGVSYYHQSGNLSAAVDITTGAWFKFAIVQNGTTGTFYGADATGTLAQVAAGTVPAVTKSNIFIGTDSYGEWWNGRIAGVKAWNAVLTLTELQAELASYTAVRTSNLIRVHKLQVPETTDYSGNANTLTGGTGTTTEADPPISGGGSVSGVAAAALGALTATATAIPTVNATAAASLGALTAAATGTPTVTGSAAAAMGGLTATATGVVTVAPLVWSGHTWQIRGGTGAPGPNPWGTTSASVEIDGDDLLLKIADIGGTWTSAEIDRTGSQLGYGRYRWTYSYDVENMDHKPVLGLYVYDQDPAASPSQREIDLEITKWNAATETSTMWYSVQPAADGDHLGSDHAQSFESPYTAEFVWESDQVYFRTEDANGALLGEHVVTDGVQAPGTEQPSMNLWLVNGDAPSDGLPVVARLHSFEFTPSVTHSLVAAEDQSHAFDDPWQFAAKDGAEVTGGELVLPCTSGYTSAYSGSTFDLRDSHTQIEISGVPTPAGGFSQEALWALRYNADNYLMMFVSGGSFVGRLRQGGTNSDVGLGTHSPTTHRFWRIELSGTTVSFRTSPDGASWTTIDTATTSLSTQKLSTLRHRFECGHWDTETAPNPLRVTQVGEPLTVNATAAASLGALAATATAARVNDATAAATLGGLTATATATPMVIASAAASLGALTAAAVGSRIWAGTATATFSALTATAAGVPTVLGVATAGPSVESDFPSDEGYPADDLYPGEGIPLGLGPLTATATGTVSGPEVAGTAAASLGGLTATAIGDVTAEVITATAAANLGALTAAAVGGSFGEGEGSATALLGPLTATAAATITSLATATADLGALTATATAGLEVTAIADAPLGGLVATAVGERQGDISAVAAAPLGPLTAAGIAVVEIIGVAEAMGGELTATAGGVLTKDATATADLGALTATADGQATTPPAGGGPLHAGTPVQGPGIHAGTPQRSSGIHAGAPLPV